MLGLRQLVMIDLIRGRDAQVQGAASPKGDVKPDFVGFGPPGALRLQGHSGPTSRDLKRTAPAGAVLFS
jgi:hypothetical protein